MGNKTGQAETTPLTENNEYNRKDVNLFQTFKGIMAALAYALLVATSGVSVQLLERRIPDLELNGIRSFTPFVFSAIWIIFKRKFPVVPRKDLCSVTVYGCLICGNTICRYTAITFLPIATVQCITITGNVLLGMVLFALCLKEHVSISTAMACILTVTGVFLVVQPEVIFKPFTLDTKYNHSIYVSPGNKTNSGYDPSNSYSQLVLGYTLAAATGLVASINIIIIKTTPLFTEDRITVLFWTYVMGTLLSFLGMICLEKPVLPTTWQDVLFIAGHSLSYTFMWPAYMYALSYIQGNTMTVTCSASTVFMLIAQYTFLSPIHPGNRNWMEIVGVTLVILGSTLTSLMELIRNVKRTDKK